MVYKKRFASDSEETLTERRSAAQKPLRGAPVISERTENMIVASFFIVYYIIGIIFSIIYFKAESKRVYDDFVGTATFVLFFGPLILLLIRAVEDDTFEPLTDLIKNLKIPRPKELDKDEFEYKVSICGIGKTVIVYKDGQIWRDKKGYRLENSHELNGIWREQIKGKQTKEEIEKDRLDFQRRRFTFDEEGNKL